MEAKYEYLKLPTSMFALLKEKLILRFAEVISDDPYRVRTPQDLQVPSDLRFREFELMKTVSP